MEVLAATGTAIRITVSVSNVLYTLFSEVTNVDRNLRSLAREVIELQGILEQLNREYHNPAVQHATAVNEAKSNSVGQYWKDVARYIESCNELLTELEAVLNKVAGTGGAAVGGGGTMWTKSLRALKMNFSGSDIEYFRSEIRSFKDYIMLCLQLIVVCRVMDPQTVPGTVQADLYATEKHIQHLQSEVQHVRTLSNAHRPAPSHRKPLNLLAFPTTTPPNPNTDPGARRIPTANDAENGADNDIDNDAAPLLLLDESHIIQRRLYSAAQLESALRSATRLYNSATAAASKPPLTTAPSHLQPQPPPPYPQTSYPPPTSSPYPYPAPQSHPHNPLLPPPSPSRSPPPRKSKWHQSALALPRVIASLVLIGLLLAAAALAVAVALAWLLVEIGFGLRRIGRDAEVVRGGVGGVWAAWKGWWGWVW